MAGEPTSGGRWLLAGVVWFNGSGDTQYNIWRRIIVLSESSESEGLDEVMCGRYSFYGLLGHLDQRRRDRLSSSLESRR